MKHLFPLLLIVLRASLGVAADPAATPVSDDNKLLNGKWTPIAAVIGGIKLPADELKKITLTLSGDTYEVAVLGEDHVDKGTATRDTTTTPKRLTIKSLEGPNKGKTFLAIYEIKTVNGVDAYRVCYDLSGTAFPTEFKSVKGSQLYLAGYRRKKE
ncbi:TIGR03067 domain-containing protein [Prosthecobacter sp.]|uniref:TIGR03067 domain-containing protein n=1 Tax=Prosthecobacter sp. TaxID=1965333 RepID=UPI001D78A9CA|nr:TIGR03067 domain-containing protein [Prosthecobacter sp.]MCB1278390.1 TIGR03067 domain-containing protein [Prosthecobacter sp.]